MSSYTINISDFGNSIHSAVSLLDESGENETISKVLCIVYSALRNAEKGILLNPIQMYQDGLKRFDLDKSEFSL